MSTHMATMLVGTMLFVSTVFAQSGGTPDASPGAPELDPNAPVYLALGDSLAFGVGASDEATTAYVPLVYDYLRETLPDGADLQLLNIGKSGSTSTTMVESQLPVALSLIEQHNLDDDPANDVKVVTIDIGGNDAFKPLREVCATGMSASCVQAVEDVFETFAQNLTKTLSQLRAADPELPIAIMTNFNTLIACEQQAIAPAAELVLEGAPDGSMPGMNDIIREVAAGTNVLVAEAYGQVEAGELVGGTDCLHPNDAGHQEVADAFIAAIAGTAPATPVAALSPAARW